MKNFTKIAVLAVLVMGTAAMLQPVEAACSSARLFSSGYLYTPGCSGDYYNAGGPRCGGADDKSPSMSQAATGVFWAVGSGNPAVGPGNDNGAFPFDGQNPASAGAGWAKISVAYGYGYPTYVSSTWAADGRIDNCVDAAPNKCMAILAMDDVVGDTITTGAFALMTADPDGLGNYEFPGAVLTTVPALRITGSVRTGGGTGVDVSVDGISLADIESGLQLGCSSTGELVQGYQVFARETGRGDAPPSNDTGDWTPVGGVNGLGQGTTVSVACTGENDVWIAAAIVFDSGYANQVVVGNPQTDLGEALRVECGANLAEPDGLRIERKPRSRELPRSRTRGR